MSLQAGDTVDHFQVVRLLGQGGAGDVWLARDQVLGRKVALKMVRTTASGTALNDLLDEARATATVVHPHVVTVYAVGSVSGVPYLALEYVDGVTLRQRLAERPTSTPEALRYARDIASALSCAHGEGVLHLDLKPDNVLLGSDGRLRVVDFGLARLRRPGVEADRAGTSIAGTPAWMAPELWRGEAPTEAADAWAFGVVLCELLTGRVPFPQARVSELVQALFSPQETPLPPLPADLTVEVRGLLARLLHKDPTRRPALHEVVPILEAALSRPIGAVVVDENPFRGLDAFREVDAGRYFGREAEIESFVTQLSTTPFLPIVGHSGAGKSSFVRAGVIPRLREGEPWLVVELRPGPRPFLALARALRQARSRLVPRTTPSQEHPPIIATLDDIDVTETGSGAPSRTFVSDPERTEPVRALATTLAEAPERLYLELSRLAKDAGAKVLLFVDQLEEADTLAADEKTTQAFLHALAAAADDPADPVRVVVTLRDDFLGRLAAVEALRGAFARVTVLRRPSLSALVESIISPLLPTGVAFDDGSLPLEMARAVEHEPAALPLLSFTCAALWEQRDVEKRRLLRAVYTRLGGVVGALATHADAVLDGLSPSQQRQARSLLLGLVTTERTRRRRSRRELLSGAGDGAAAVLDRLIAARLLTAERGQRDDDSEIELAHEALVRTWARLARFLDEEREQLDFTAELQQAADVWSRRGRRTSEVWTGAALQDALARVERAALPLPETARVFLDEGRREDRRRARQRSAAVVALVAFLVVVAGALFVARGRAVVAAKDARMARAVAEREAGEAALSRSDVWRARAKIRTSLELDDSREARAVWRRIEANALLFSTRLSGPIVDGVFADDGTIVTIHMDDRAFLFDRDTFGARDFAIFRDTRSSMSTVAVLGDRALFGLRDDGRLALVDLTSGRVVRILEVHDGGSLAIAPDPTRRRFLSAGRDGLLRVIGVDGEVGETLVSHTGGIERVVVTDDGATAFALGFDDALVEVPLDGRDDPAPLPTGGDARDLLALEDGTVLVGLFDGQLLRLDRQRRFTPVGNVGEVLRLATDGRRRRLAVRSGSGEITLWRFDVDDDGRRRVIPIAWLEAAGAGGIGALTMDAVGERLLSTTRDGDVRVWRIDDATLARRVEPAAPYNDIAISSDGARVGEIVEGGVVVRDATSGDIVSWVPFDGRIHGIALDDVGRRILIGGAERIVIHDPLGREPRRVLRIDDAFNGAVWLPDGGVAFLTRAGIHLVPPGAAAATLSTRVSEQPVSIERSPDGQRLLVGGRDGTAFLLSRDDLRELRRFRVADTYSVTGVAFSADGGRVALSTSTVLEVRTVDGALVRRLPGDRIAGACTGFLPDGRVLDLRSDGVVVVDVDSGAGTPRFSVPPTGSCAATSGGRLAMRLGDYVIPFDVTADAPLWFSRAVLQGRISTQRGGPPWPPGDAIDILDVDDGGTFLCTAEGGGRFTVRTPDGVRVLAETRDETAWPMVVAALGGCVWQHDDTLVRLRADGRRDVVATDIVAFGGGEGIVVGVGGARVRVLQEGGERALPLGDVVIDGAGVLTVAQGQVVHALPSGTIAIWPLATTAPPRLVRGIAGDITAVLPLSGGLVAVGTGGERLYVVDEASGVPLVDEVVRGAVFILHERREGGRHTLEVGTNLGAIHTVDLGAIVGERCTVLQAVWQAAPVAWERGRAEARPPPPDHVCATAAR
jgi:WD40 repeat protein